MLGGTVYNWSNRSWNTGQSGSYTQIVTNANTSQQLYYYCNAHLRMGGSISISTTNLTKTDEYVAKLTTTAVGNYKIDVNANTFTDANNENNIASTQFSFNYV